MGTGTAACVFLAAAAVMAAAQPVPVFAPCTGSDDQLWEYQQQAFVVHRSSGLALVATGAATESGLAPVELTDTPDQYHAQWIHMPYPGSPATNYNTSQLHAFRTAGNRCLQVARGCGSATGASAVVRWPLHRPSRVTAVRSPPARRKRRLRM